MKSTTKEFRMSENAPHIDAKNPAGWCYLIYEMESNHSLRKQPFLLAPCRWGRLGCFRRLIKPQLGKHISGFGRRFWIPPCGFRNRFLQVELGFWVIIVIIVSRISDSLSLIPDSKAQEQAKISRILES